MAVDYDLVILGGTPEGYEAAAQAIRYGARVALMLQDLDGARSPLLHQGLLHLTAGQPIDITASPSSASQWQYLKQRATLIADRLTQNTAQELMVQGVDVIAEQGKIVSDRPLTVATNTRKLTTRAVLIATGSRFRVPPLKGMDTGSYETPVTFWQREQLPSSVVILGSRPEGLLLAQWLARRSIKLSLVTARTELLSHEDPDVAKWLRAQLQAQGVDLRLGVRAETVTRGKQTTLGTETMVLQIANEDAITAEALVVAGRSAPNTDDLGLACCLPPDRPLTVNRYLQTAHPRIYVCGAAMGGYDLPAIARQEAQWAVHNALFWNRRRVDYSNVPYDLPTQPPIARVGLTEPQALQRFDRDDVLVARRSLYDHPVAQWRDSTIGFCKLIAHRNGRILGCHGVGPEAPEWVQTIALAMRQEAPWWQLAKLPTLPYSLTELLRQTAQQWEGDRWQPGRWRRDCSENWCNWRRSR